MDGNYKVKLFYGYKGVGDTIQHSFGAFDTRDDVDAEVIRSRLAKSLKANRSGDKFNYDVAIIPLPQSLINRIKTEAIIEYEQMIYDESVPLIPS